MANDKDTMSRQPVENVCENVAVVQEMIIDECCSDDVNNTITDLEHLSENTISTLQKLKIQWNGISVAIREMKEELKRSEEKFKALTDKNFSLKKENGYLHRTKTLYDKAIEEVNKLSTKTEVLESLVQETEGHYREKENTWFRENQELREENIALRKKLDEQQEKPSKDSKDVRCMISDEQNILISPRPYEFQDIHFQTGSKGKWNRCHRRGRLYSQNRASRASTFVTISPVKSPPE